MDDVLNLCDKHRPEHLKDIYGQDHVVSFFRSVIQKPEESPRYYGIFSGFGLGKCVGKDTWIKTVDRVVPISRLVGIHSDEGWQDITPVTLKQAKHLGDKEINKGYNSGVKPGLKIYTNGTYPIEVTPHHPLRIWDTDLLKFRWVKAEELKQGDTLVSDRTPITSTDKRVENDLDFYFLGILYSSIATVGEPKLSSSSLELNSFLLSSGLLAKYEISVSNTGLICQNVNKPEVFQLLNHYGLPTLESLLNSKVFLLRATFKEQLSFVRGLLDYLGYYDSEGILCFSHSSSFLMSFVAAVVNAVGSRAVFVPSIDTDFTSSIGMLEITGSLFQLTNLHSRFVAYTNDNHLPLEFFSGMTAKLVKEMKKRGVPFEELHQFKWYKHTWGELTVRNILAAQKDLAKLGYNFNILPEGYYPATVTAICTTETHMLDLNNPHNHSFVGNGLVCHNTTLARAFARDLIGKGYEATPNYIEVDSSEKRVADNFDILKEYLFQEVNGFKVVVIDECHLLPQTVSQKLLKILEDFTSNLYLFFCSTNPELMFPPLLSRLHKFNLYTMTAEQCKDYASKIIQKENLTISDKALSIAALNSQGHLRDMLKQLELIIFQGEDNYLQNFSTAWSLIESYFRGTEPVTNLIPKLFVYHPTQLQQFFSYYFRDFILNPAAKDYGKIIQPDLMPKVFAKYLQLSVNIKNPDDFFGFLFVFSQLLEAVRVKG